MARKRGVIDYSKIIDKIVEGDKKGGFKKVVDPNEYIIKIKEDGTANAIIRFLPPKIGEETPFVKMYNHGWQDSGGWFIDNCPTTIGEKCPVCTEYFKYLNMYDKDHKMAKDRKRKTSFWANILVIKDPQCPENEGKVLKFRYGVKIHDMIMEKLKPADSEIDEPIPVFDYDLGANFKLKVTTGQYRNYDKSEFTPPSPIGIGSKALTDAQIDAIDEQLHSLAPIIDKSQFNSYEELAEKYIKKTGITISLDPNDIEKNISFPEKVEETTPEPVVTENIDEEPDTDEEFFKNLDKRIKK